MFSSTKKENEELKKELEQLKKLADYYRLQYMVMYKEVLMLNRVVAKRNRRIEVLKKLLDDHGVTQKLREEKQAARAGQAKTTERRISAV